MGGLLLGAFAASGSAGPQGLAAILKPVNSHCVRLPRTLNRLYFFVVAWEVDAIADKCCPAASTLEPALSPLCTLLLQNLHSRGLSLFLY